MTQLINAVKRFARTVFRQPAQQNGPIILMYHRIGSPQDEPWGLAVSSEHFAEQLEILCRTRRVMALAEFVKLLLSRSLPADAVAITFDDGYADNLHVAKPLLEKYGMPATIFIATQAIDAAVEFWWDELGRILFLPSSLPEYLTIASDQWPDRTIDIACRETARREIYFFLWKHLKSVTAAERDRLLDRIRKWAGIPFGRREDRRSLTSVELRLLEQGGLVEIGAHSVTHPSLPPLSNAVRQKEIQQSKNDLEGWLTRSVNGFAYPFGDYDRATVSSVRGLGFHYACTTEHHAVTNRANPFRLPRFQAQDWNGDEFERQFLADSFR